MTKTISLIVPCYNEEKSLPFFYKAFLELQKRMEEVEIELILVDDGSKDTTLEILQNFAKINNVVKYISFSRNFGKEAAMLAGMKHATGDYVIIADADLQHPLEMIEEMYKIIITNEYDCVAARRLSRTGEPPIRSFLANCFYKLINRFSATEITSGATDFRLMKKAMVESVLELHEYNRFSKGLFSFVGYNTKWLEYQNVERIAGETTWSFFGLFKYSLEGILAFTTAPLHLASILGLIICFFAFIFAAYIVIATTIWGNPVAGYPTLTCLILFMGGVQLFCIGILSEYISKIYSEVKKRPIYIIKNTSMEKICK